MGGVDLADQLKESYQINRRCKKWWHRIFFHLLDVSVVNAFLLAKSSDPTTTNKLFRIHLAEQLCGSYCGVSTTSSTHIFRKRVNGDALEASKHIRLDMVGRHMPVSNGKQDRCKLCASKHQRHTSTIKCSTCDLALCINSARNCFREYHINES